MTEEEKKEKISQYSTRLTFWTNQGLVQFGYSINLFTTISIAVVGYLVSHRSSYPALHFNCDGKVEYRLIIYFISLILAFTSTLLGGIAVLSRLYDFRLTRHKIFVRKQVLEKLNTPLSDGFIDTSTVTIFSNFKAVLFKKIEFVIETDFKDIEEIKRKFIVIRRQTKLLGDMSWRSHKLQIIFIVFSIILYSLLILKN